MYKILILAYLIGQSPIETQQTFQMGQTFNNVNQLGHCGQDVRLKTYNP